jgi:hypothetical protein
MEMLLTKTDLPSSHGGGVLPGNQMGLLGSAAARTANDDLAAAGSLLPPRKDGARSPLLGRFATEVVEDEEAETSAIVPTQWGWGSAAVWRQGNGVRVWRWRAAV